MSNSPAVCVALSCFMMLGRIAHASPPSLEATQLPSLPDTVGIAGPFVGVSGNALIVAGGTNFPDRPPWENGTKTWYDRAYVLPGPDAHWRQGFELPRKLAYGVSISAPGGLVCLGGCDEIRNYSEAFVLHWDGKTLTSNPLPSLPQPTSCAAGARIGSRVYVAGGQPGPDPLAGPSSSNFWMLDLDDAQRGWSQLPSWPGPERFYAVAATDGEHFFLLSGIRRVVNERMEPALEYLKDAYRFDPSTQRWQRLPDLPRANAAVATPAPLVGGRLLLIGRGADGRNVDRPLHEREPFGGEVLGYDLHSGRWQELGALAFGRVATPAVWWRGRIVIASGESRPGVRSNEVWSIR